MANKIVALFLMCFFLAAAISVQARVKPYIDYVRPVKPDEFKPYIDFVPVKPTQVKPYVDYLPVKPTQVKPYVDYLPVKPTQVKPYVDYLPVKPTQVKPYVDYLPVKPTAAHEEPVLFRFAKCFETCKSECVKLQDEYNCEMKCDSECSAKEFADKLGVKI